MVVESLANQLLNLLIVGFALFADDKLLGLSVYVVMIRSDHEMIMSQSLLTECARRASSSRPMRRMSYSSFQPRFSRIRSSSVRERG